MTASPAALHAAAAAITQGNPAECVYVSDRITVVTSNPVSASRWRESFGGQLAGVPLDVVAVTPVGVTS